jgi:hypothetical protein
MGSDGQNMKFFVLWKMGIKIFTNFLGFEKWVVMGKI